MHITEILLDAYHRGKLSAEELIEIQHAHFVATCEACSQGIAAHENRLRHGRAGSAAGPWNPVRRFTGCDGWGERYSRAQLDHARRDLGQILNLDQKSRCQKVQGSNSRFYGRLFGRLLLDEARRRVPAEPAEALALAEVAHLSGSKKRGRCVPIPEIQAAALAVTGNAKRALGRLQEAEADLGEALRLLDGPEVRDPALPAEVYSYLGSLRRDQGKLDEAERDLHLGHILYDALGKPEKAAAVLLKLGEVHFHAHQHDDAVAATEEALALLPPDAGAWLRACAHFDLAFRLHARGDLDRAEEELEAHAELLAAAGERVAQHVVWLRARIAWSRQDLRAAERLYRDAKTGMAALGFFFETSLIILELALVHLVQGRTARVKTLAAEALRTLADQEEVEREIWAAVALADEAARREDLTRQILERTIASLERARHARPATGRQPT